MDTERMRNDTGKNKAAIALGEYIRREAVALGFSACGFAPAVSLDKNKANLAEWLSRGWNGTMEWMNRPGVERFKASTCLPDAKSVVSLAINYFTPGPDSKQLDGPLISRYARFRDYHKVVGKKLDMLLFKLRTVYPTVNGTTAVDRHPISEKAFAESAGIGWIGKNTCLITKKLGSWVFLGELIIDAELPYDTPHLDYCGSCNRCLEACPTGALVEPYKIDARRCIGYTTIETELPVPDEIARNSGNWVFGCDICQEVCPWNRRHAKPTTKPDFSPRPDLAQPTWKDLIEIYTPESGDSSEDTVRERFLNKFAGTPVMRAGVRRFASSLQIARANASAKGEQVD